MRDSFVLASFVFHDEVRIIIGPVKAKLNVVHLSLEHYGNYRLGLVNLNDCHKFFARFNLNDFWQPHLHVDF